MHDRSISKTDGPAPVDKPEGSPFRALPSVTVAVDHLRQHGSTLDDALLARVVDTALERERTAIAAGARPDRAEIEARLVAEALGLERVRLAPVINATGVIVHTNLGRAPVSSETAAAMADAAAGAVALEIELETNERGGRMSEVAALLRHLCGAEATLVVNNCAAATLLVLSAVAAGKNVVVSRGEAVEIGGGFRVPDVLAQSGATLVEVGTTNRTYPADYAAATDDATAAYLKVHASNFRMLGFTRTTTIAELAEVARPRGVAVLDDIGSGALLDTARYGLAPEPTFADALAAGAHLVMASGDKLLGGPQAGIVVGERAWVEQVARHPLARAVRADKTCLAGLAATLRHYARGEADRRIPIWRMIAAPPTALAERARHLQLELAGRGVSVDMAETAATVGGGSLPGETLPSCALSLAPPATTSGDLDALARRLRLGQPGVFGRIERDRLLLDLRTVLPEDDDRLAAAVGAAF